MVILPVSNDVLFKKASQKVFFDGDREEYWELYKKRGGSVFFFFFFQDWYR